MNPFHENMDIIEFRDKFCAAPSSSGAKRSLPMISSVKEIESGN